MNGQTRAGFIILEKEHFNGRNIDVLKLVTTEGKDYVTHIMKFKGENDIDMYEERFETTSLACKNKDKVQIIAFGGNDCTEIEKVQKLGGIVEEIFNQTTDKHKRRKGRDVNVTTIGYTINPLLEEGANIERTYDMPLELLARRIFNTDGSIEDIRNRAANTILFSHCVGGVCVDRIIEALENELVRKGATKSQISEILNSLIAINYAKYVPQQWNIKSKIPTVNLFQVYDLQNDGSWFMREDVSAQDTKKIRKILERAKREMCLVSEVKRWNGAIVWNNEDGNILNISLDKLKSKGGKVHNPSDLILHCEKSESSSLLKDFMESFNEWRDEIVEGKHNSSVKIPILRQKLIQNSLGKQM